MSDEKDLLGYENSLADYLLLDSGKGSGKTFDWHLIRSDLQKEFFLAGGINSTNIKEAIEKLFKVKVTSIRTINVKPKKRRVGRYTGLTNRSKKAIVTLA